jgi:hypothetical protein
MAFIPVARSSCTLIKMVFMRLLRVVMTLIASIGGLACAQESTAQTAAVPNSLYGVVFAPPVCQRVNTTTTDCSLLGTYSGKDANSVLTVLVVRARVFAADGAAFVASEFSGGGAVGVAGQGNVSFPRGIPVRLTFRFKGVPNSLSTLRGLAFETVNYENIRIADAPRATPDPVSTTALVSLPTRASTPIKFNVALSDCTVSGATYTCTARLSPAR